MKSKQELYNNRPTSPHLSIYKPQISTSLSILHRMTGIGLFFAVSILIWWFIFFSLSTYKMCCFELFKCGIIKVCLIILSFAWFYHLCNGIRHLAWDSGYGFSIKAVNITGWSAVILSVIMTILLWI